MKPIRLTPQAMQAAKQAFNESLEGLRFQGEKLTFSYNFEEEFKKHLPENTPKPVVYMSAATYLKLLQFVLQCDKEIAWHGTVERNGYNFFIKDVFLYPQRVTAVTVQTDDTKYTQWAEKLPDDVFNKMRFQGHSHVNMGTTPSGVDTTNWNDFLQNLLDDDFYIFMIINKSQDINLLIYDLANNLIFERADIAFKVYFNKETEISYIKADMEKYLEKPAPTPSYNPYNSGGNRYGRDSIWDDYRDDYYGQGGIKKNTTSNIIGFAESPKKEKAIAKVKRHVVIMNRNGRYFEKEFPEYEGERINARQNGKNYEVFIPYKPFETRDIQDLRKDGWHVREMLIPEEYTFE